MDGTTMDDDFGDDIIAFPPLRAADGSPLPDTPKPNITNPVQPENIFLPDDAHTSTDEASDEEVAADSDDGDNTHSSVTLERRLQLAAGRCAHTCQLERIDISIKSFKQKSGCHYWLKTHN